MNSAIWKLVLEQLDDDLKEVRGIPAESDLIMLLLIQILRVIRGNGKCPYA